MLIISQSKNIINLIGASGMVTVYKDEYVGFTTGDVAVYKGTYPVHNNCIGIGEHKNTKPAWR